MKNRYIDYKNKIIATGMYRLDDINDFDAKEIEEFGIPNGKPWELKKKLQQHFQTNNNNIINNNNSIINNSNNNINAIINNNSNNNFESSASSSTALNLAKSYTSKMYFFFLTKEQNPWQNQLLVILLENLYLFLVLIITKS